MMAMPDLQRYPLNLILIPIVKDVVVILTQMFLILIIYPLILKSKKCASHHTTNENKQFKEKKHGHLIHTISNKDFNGTVVNQASPSLKEIQ